MIDNGAQLTVQQPVDQSSHQDVRKGSINTDGVSSYINSVMQCLLSCPALCQAMQQTALVCSIHVYS